MNKVVNWSLVCAWSFSLTIFTCSIFLSNEPIEEQKGLKQICFVVNCKWYLFPHRGSGLRSTDLSPIGSPLYRGFRKGRGHPWLKLFWSKHIIWQIQLGFVAAHYAHSRNGFSPLKCRPTDVPACHKERLYAQLLPVRFLCLLALPLNRGTVDNPIYRYFSLNSLTKHSTSR